MFNKKNDETTLWAAHVTIDEKKVRKINRIRRYAETGAIIAGGLIVVAGGVLLSSKVHENLFDSETPKED